MDFLRPRFLGIFLATLGAAFSFPTAAISQTNVVREVINVGPAQIEVRSQGQGDVVVVLGGAGGVVSSLDWFGELVAANGSRVLAINQRGPGASEGLMSNLTLHDYAADVVGVLDALSVEKATLIGFSGGNRIARMVAADHPDRVQGVILVAAGGLVPPDPEALAMQLIWIQEQGTLDERISAFRVSMLSPASNAEDFDPPVNVPSAYRALLEASNATPVAEWWSGGNAQMLVLQGEDDLIAPVSNGIALKNEFPDRVTLVNVPDAGHMLREEKSDVVVAEVLKFIDRLRQ